MDAIPKGGVSGQPDFKAYGGLSSYTQGLAVLYHNHEAGIGLWEFSSKGSGVEPRMIWQHASWDWRRTQIVVADVRHVGRPDGCALYGCANGDLVLWLLPSLDTANQPQLLWHSQQTKRDWTRSKFLAADLQGNGAMQLCALSDFGNGDLGLWVFVVAGTSVEPILVWRSGRNNWDWQRCSVIAADVRGVGKAEVSILYDYGNNEAGLWVFPSNTPSVRPLLMWRSGAGNWVWQRTKWVGAYVRGVGNQALCALYDFGQQDSGLWVFQPDSVGAKVHPSLVWRSGLGNWDWQRSWLAAADVRNTGRSELCVLYDGGEDGVGLWIFPYDGSLPIRSLVWRSGAGNWARHGIVKTVAFS